MATVTTEQMSGRGNLLTWRSPPQLTLSPSREEAREKRHAELRSTLEDWKREYPERTGMREAGQRLPDIPLESVPIGNRRPPSAAAGSARELAPTSPDPEEAYSPPLEAGDWWASEELANREPIVNRVSPLMTPLLLSAPTVVGEEAVGLAPARVETPPLTFPGSLMGVAGPRRCRCCRWRIGRPWAQSRLAWRRRPLPSPETREELELFERRT